MTNKIFETPYPYRGRQLFSSYFFGCLMRMRSLRNFRHYANLIMKIIHDDFEYEPTDKDLLEQNVFAGFLLVIICTVGLILLLAFGS